MAQLTGSLNLLVYNDSSTTTNPQKRLQDIKIVLSDTSIAQWESKLLTIASATVDQTIAFDSISSDYLYILSSSDISIKLNGSLTALNVSAGFPFLMKGLITSLSVSNAGAAAQVEIGIGK